jgi:carbon-monoxide dehydrogenase medium subunit
MPRPIYRRAATLDEATALLAEHGSDAAVLSGGQSLIPMMSAGLAAPDVLIDINSVEDSGALEETDGGLRIATGVRHRALEWPSGAVAAKAPAVPRAAPFISHPAVRNRGTFVGSVAHADPSAEWPAVAVALDATITLRRHDGQRTVPAEEFFVGPMTTVREPEELLSEIHLPTATPGSVAAVLELAYRSGDYAIVGVVAQARIDDGRITDPRVALFGVDAVPRRAHEAERILTEGGLAAVEDAAAAARDAADPQTDATASRGYRLEMIRVYVERAIRQCAPAVS